MSPIFSTISLGARALGLTELSFSFVTSTTSTTRTFTVPASSQAGDLVIYVTSSGVNGGTGDLTDSYKPADWTRIYRNAFSGGGDEDSVHDVAYKIIASGDVSAVKTVAAANHDEYNIVALVFRPTKTFGVTIETTNHQVGDLDPTAQTINGTAVSTLPQLLFATYWTYNQGGGGSVLSRSWTGGTYTEATTRTSFYTRYKMFNIGDTKENVTVDMADNTTDHNRLFSMILSFA